ncbi:XRE family transcriptional regulator [Streptomyces fragilis]|uniref:XRE family transcriptional regulator n=1 Tax=Streptomyces fragilis TaxID=67301 RepID=A0ABV2YIY2_9ACTN|nr:XRE family transcriptional regulator [Streptomyces fragilis]
MQNPRQMLADTLAGIDGLLGDRSRDDVLDTAQLSVTSGVPVDVVEALLAGRTPPEESVTDRIIRRFEHLRDTRRRPDGRRYSYEEIARSFGATKASLSNLVRRRNTEHRRTGGPLASTQAGVERFFFGAENGWLSAAPEMALDQALQPVLAALQREAGEEAFTHRRAVTLRSAAALPDDKWRLVEGFVATLEAQVREELRRP